MVDLPRTRVSELDKRLATYEPATVKAAQHYAEIVNMRSILRQSIPAMRDAIIRIIREKNPERDDATLVEFVEVSLKAGIANAAELYEKFTIVTMLDIFTAEEIIAVDKFYSSDVGRSMLKKMPQVTARMIPQMFEVMQRQIVPLVLEEAQKALKANSSPGRAVTDGAQPQYH
ncbi:DUF2059 domain-containing protein [Taklimakanibacter deserti]|uniref:DUF2059 domain-containing protein n=1 Tax=Taklimakanibacter deserti TaxID=2267839 RepID=UPI000E6537BE